MFKPFTFEYNGFMYEIKVDGSVFKNGRKLGLNMLSVYVRNIREEARIK